MTTSDINFLTAHQKQKHIHCHAYTHPTYHELEIPLVVKMSTLNNYMPRWMYQDSNAWVTQRRQAIDREAERLALLEASNAPVPQDQRDRLQAAREELAVIVSAIGKQKMD